jgi:hypothetical protein
MSLMGQTQNSVDTSWVTYSLVLGQIGFVLFAPLSVLVLDKIGLRFAFLMGIFGSLICCVLRCLPFLIFPDSHWLGRFQTGLDAQVSWGLVLLAQFINGAAGVGTLIASIFLFICFLFQFLVQFNLFLMISCDF